MAEENITLFPKSSRSVVELSLSFSKLLLEEQEPSLEFMCSLPGICKVQNNCLSKAFGLQSKVFSPGMVRS